MLLFVVVVVVSKAIAFLLFPSSPSIYPSSITVFSYAASTFLPSI